MSQYQYKAFISYSHKDTDIAEQIHKELEHYKVPGRLVGKSTSVGVIQKKLGSFFRDREELPVAEDLTTEVKKALENSEFMIVLCSPSAAASRWVNREIIEFKKLRGDKYVLPLIINGTPWASDSDKPEEECFPPAVRYKISPAGTLSHIRTEPIAADIKQGNDGYKRGVQKLIAGLLGVGLDRLVERELQRKQRRVMAITSASVLGMIVMGGLTYQATIARQAAEQHRAEAEDLIEFMLTDLRKKLEPVGRLDVLDSVGTKAVSYYNGQDLDDIPDNAIGRRARAFHLLGEIQNQRGNRQEADVMFRRANEATEDLLARAPNNPQRIYEHSQSLYYVGFQAWQLGDYVTAEKAWNGYKNFSQQLVAIDPKNTAWQFELAYAHSNIGTLQLRNLFQPRKAHESFSKSLSVFINLERMLPENVDVQYELADGYAWVADSLLEFSSVSKVRQARLKEKQILSALLSKNPRNSKVLGALHVPNRALAHIAMTQGNFKEAIKLFTEALHIARNLKDKDSENQEWKSKVGMLHFDLTHAYILGNKLDLAQDHFKQGQAIGKEILSNDFASVEQTIQFQINAELLKFQALKEQNLSLKNADEILKIFKGIQNKAPALENSLFAKRVLSSLYLLLIEIYQKNDANELADQLLYKLWHGETEVGKLKVHMEQSPKMLANLLKLAELRNDTEMYDLLVNELANRGYEPTLLLLN